MKRLLITGASGFIGSHLVKALCAMPEKYSIRAFVRGNDTKNIERLFSHPPYLTAQKKGRCHLVLGDLTGDINGLCEGVDAVIHTAALTFVDRSIVSPEPFVQSNVVGTLRLLEDARKYKVGKWIQVSTDEVYGAILQGAYKEDARLNPTNVYGAAKAGADCLCLAYANTYKLNTLITRTENNYGPWQHPQKVIPTFVRALINGDRMPIYGDGGHVRQWLHVDDHVRALIHILEYDTNPGEIYHVAGAQELTNLELAKKILGAFNGMEPVDYEDNIRFIDDHNIRPGHDRRYALDTTKITATGWKPQVKLDDGIRDAVRWYKENAWWLQ